MKSKGFTLVELLIALAVGAIIMTAVYGVMNMAQQSSSSIDRKTLTQQDTRAVMNLMAMEIRMASFNRRNNSAVWATVPSAASVPACTQMGLAAAVTARKGIQLAGDNEILIAMDLNADNIIGPDPADPTKAAANEYIYYNLNNQGIIRNVNCGGNQTILGGAGSSTLVVNPSTSPMFTYYNEADQDISAVVKSAPNTNIPLIRRIRITIVAKVEKQGSQFEVSPITYTTDVLVKNHVLSP